METYKQITIQNSVTGVHIYRLIDEDSVNSAWHERLGKLQGARAVLQLLISPPNSLSRPCLCLYSIHLVQKQNKHIVGVPEVSVESINNLDLKGSVGARQRK